MKKIYMLLVAILVVNFSFAQIAKQDVRTDGLKGIGKPVYHNTAAKAGAGSYWFDLTDGLWSSMPGFDFSAGQVLMLQDSVALIHYSNGDGRPQFFSMAQVFDFSDPNWVYFYENYFDEETGMPIPVPAMTETNSYSIDSMSCVVAYLRGDNVPADVVDTLVMTIAAFSDTLQYMSIGSNTEAGFETWWSQPWVPFSLNSYTIPSQYDDEGTTMVYDYYYTVKLPLTADDDCMVDSTSFQWATVSMPVEGFENLTTKSIIVSYSFISASPRTLDTEYGVDCSSLRGYVMEDPREGYDVDGSDASINDLNTSLCAMEFSYDPNILFYEGYVNNKIWIGALKRPAIGVHVTCDDCAWVNIEDVEENDMVVRPNPATEAFTVDFAQDAPATVQLFNLVGQQVYSAEVNASNLSVNVSEFNPGVYMLRVAQDGKVYTSKVIVK